MPDFTAIQTAAEHATRQPEFATIERRAARLRGRHRIAAGAGATGVAALTVAVAITGGQLLGNHNDADTLARGVPVNGIPAGSQVRSFVAGDANHLYATIEQEGCMPSCTSELYASDDGGQTWWSRGELPRPPATGVSMQFEAAAGQTIVMSSIMQAREAFNAEAIEAPLRVSPDGGTTWHPVTRDSTPVAAVPAGAHMVGGLLAGDSAAHSLDPATGTMRPLAQQSIAVGAVPRVPVAAGLWLSGWDAVSSKPAVSVSRDHGLSWTTHVFEAGAIPDAGAPFRAGMYVPEVVTHDGVTAYAKVTVDSGVWTYRTTDGGSSWQRLTAVDTDLRFPSHVTPDGGLVVARMTVDGYQHEISRGGPLQPVTLTGWVPEWQMIRTASDGTYSALGGQQLFLSDDGLTFRAVSIGS